MHPKRPQDDFSAEIDAHIRLEADRFRDRGMTEEQAVAARVRYSRTPRSQCRSRNRAPARITFAAAHLRMRRAPDDVLRSGRAFTNARKASGAARAQNMAARISIRAFS